VHVFFINRQCTKRVILYTHHNQPITFQQ
jgi:hypothetical protein